MQSKLSILLLISFSLLLSGCGFDESLETSQQHDGDDMNVIQNIWPQALDQMLRWLSAPIISQQSSNVVVPSYAPSLVQKSSNQTVQLPIVSSKTSEPIIQTSLDPIVSEDIRDRENESDWEHD